MTLHLERPIPAWMVRLSTGKAAAVAEMPPDEREAYELAQAEAKRRRAARRLAAIERATTIFSLYFDGNTAAQIGAAIGRTERTVRKFARARGILISASEAFVRRALTLTMKREDALRAMAVEYGKSPADTLADLINFVLDEDAAIARRVLRVQRCAAVPRA